MSNERILIVEDDVDLVYMLEYNLRSKGYETFTALDGVSACRLIETERPDLILLDIMLPGMDGWEVCTMVRNHQGQGIRDVPIIMLTALSSVEEKLKGIEMGADDYIPKPFSIKEVLLKVDRLILREKKKRGLDNVVRKLEARKAQQNDFQDMLFHELRNQLLIIGGYSLRIAENPGIAPEKYRRCVEIIRESLYSLNSMTEEMLLLSRLESGDDAFPCHDVFIEEALRDVISAASRKANDKKTAIHLKRTGGIPALKLNPTAIQVAFANLIGNAVKYSPEGSDVTVSVGLEGGILVAVEVLDRGPGVPMRERDKIFDKFYRGENMKSHTKGTGLGLYIAKMLIESMGAAIRLDSNYENGACFRVEFPVPQARL